MAFQVPFESMLVFRASDLSWEFIVNVGAESSNWLESIAVDCRSMAEVTACPSAVAANVIHMVKSDIGVSVIV